MRTSAGMEFGAAVMRQPFGGAFTPRKLSNLKMWLDPTYTPNMTLVPGQILTGGQYLTTPHTANLAATTAFTLEFWANLWTNNNDVCFACKNQYSSSGGWCALGAANSPTGNSGASCSPNLFTGTAANSYSRITGTLNVMANALSHFVIRYSAGTVVIYRNGVSDTLGGSAVAAIVDGSLPFLIGGKFHSSHNTFDGVVGCVRYWTNDIGASDAQALWTDGYNSTYGTYSYVPYSSLNARYKTSNLVVALDGYASDFKTCQKTGRTFTDGGSASSLGYVCQRITDRSTNAYTFRQDFGGAPVYNATGINSTPCLETYQSNSNASVSKYASQCMSAQVANLTKTATGSLTFVHGMKNRLSTECFFLGATDNAAGTNAYYNYFGWELNGGSYKPFARLSNGIVATVQQNVTGPYHQVSNAASTNYVHQFNQDGTAWTMSRNGTLGTVTVGADGPGGNASTTFGSKVTLQEKAGLFAQDCFVGNANSGVVSTGMCEPQKLGQVVLTSSSLSSAQQAKLRAYVNAKHGGIY